MELQVILALLIPSITLGQLFNGFGELESFPQVFPNGTVRPKRQLFRDDIPDHRPLSGNHYAHEHGFPHPGRWSDGLRSEHKPNPRPPHQQYIDMLDGGRHGRYHGKGPSSGGGFHHHHNSHPGRRPHSFGSDIFHNAGFGAFGNFGGGGGGGGSHYYGPPKSHHNPKNTPFGNHLGSQYGPPSAPLKPSQGPTNLKAFGFGPNVFPQEYGGFGGPQNLGGGEEYDGPAPTKETHPHNEQPYVIEQAIEHQQQPHHPQKPKAFVHYHPVEYGNIINIPEKNEGGEEHDGKSVGYGPPNHTGGTPLGPIENGGFIPIKSPHGDDEVSNKDGPLSYQYPSAPQSPPHQHSHGLQQNYGQQFHNHNPPHHHHNPRPHRFDPFKIFSRPSPSYGPPRFNHQNNNNIEHDLPVAIPILAQFHTVRPLKFSKLKRPVHLLYGHGPRGRPQPQFHEEQGNLYSRLPKPPRWMTQHGLK
jgi:hypothetical protein